jgi:hypothetical protein
MKIKSKILLYANKFYDFEIVTHDPKFKPLSWLQYTFFRSETFMDTIDNVQTMSLF